MACDPITSWQIDGETMETVIDFIFLGSKITADGDCSHEINKHLLLERKALTNLYAGKDATVRTGHKQQTGSKLGKEYVKAAYCHPAYLTYMQNKSREMPDWMKHKLESRLLAEISITSDMQMAPLLWEKVKEENEKVG